jgi:hypothetical protein
MVLSLRVPCKSKRPVIERQFSQGAGGSAGLTNGELFDVRTASFAHAGQDFGQLTGPVPEPTGVSLLALMVIGVAGLLRRKVFPNLFQS